MAASELYEFEKLFEKIYSLTGKTPLQALDLSDSTVVRLKSASIPTSVRFVNAAVKLFTQHALLELEFRTTVNFMQSVMESLELILEARHSLKLSKDDEKELLFIEKITVCTLIDHLVSLCEFNAAVRVFKEYAKLFTNFGEHIGATPYVKLGTGIIFSMQQALNLCEAQKLNSEFLMTTVTLSSDEYMKQIPTKNRPHFKEELVKATKSFRFIMKQTHSLAPGCFLNPELQALMHNTKFWDQYPIRIDYNLRGRIMRPDLDHPGVREAIKGLDFSVPADVDTKQMSLFSCWIGLAQLRWISHETAKALEFANKAIDLLMHFVDDTHPMLFDAYTTKAECLLLLDQKKEANQLCIKVINSNPAKAGCLMSLLRAIDILSSNTTDAGELKIAHDAARLLLSFQEAHPSLLSVPLVESLKSQFPSS